MLQEFERRLEGAVEGFFSRAFRSGIQPIELAKAVQRYAEDNQHVMADGVVVPNVYRITVGTKDHERLEGFGASLPRELAEVVVRTAAERGWLLRGPAKARIIVDDEVKLGRFRLTGRVEAVDAPPTAGPAAPSARAGAPPASPLGPPAGAPSGGAPAPGHPQQRSGFDQTQVVSGPAVAGLHLVVRRAQSNVGTTLSLQGSRLTAGRLDRCDLTITDSTVSREHAAFVRRGERWWVVDLGSTNGTRVNGRRAAEHPIAAGDQVELGDALLELVGG